MADCRPDTWPTIFPCSWFLESYGVTHPGPWSRFIRSLEEAEEVVAEAKRQGAVTVKIYGQLHPVLARQAVEAAHKLGLSAACHPANYSAIDTDADTIEHTSSILENCLPPGTHFTWMDLSAINLEGREVQDAIQAIKKNGTAVCPTLLAVGPGWRLMDFDELREHPDNHTVPAKLGQYWDRTLARRRQEVNAIQDLAYRLNFWKKCQALTVMLHKAGVPLIVGTDAPCAFLAPGVTMHREMELLVQCGIPAEAVLRTATLAGAKAVRQVDSLGSIAPGKYADLVILSADPVRDIRNTRRISRVIHRGRIVS